MRRAARVAAGAALAAGVLALAACGGGKSSTREQPATTVPASGGSARALAAVHRAAVKSSSVDAVHLEMKTEGDGQTLKMRGDVGYSPPRAHYDIDLGKFDAEIVQVGNNMYITGDGVSDGLVSGRKWAKIDMSRAFDFDFSTVGSSRPDSALALLQGPGDFRQEGSDEIGGIEAAHYSGVLDMNDILASSDLPEKYRKQLTKQADTLPDGPIDADVWVDGEDRVVRMEIVYHWLDPTSEPVKMRIDLSEYGEPLDVEEPALADYEDVTDQVIASS